MTKDIEATLQARYPSYAAYLSADVNKADQYTIAIELITPVIPGGPAVHRAETIRFNADNIPAVVMEWYRRAHRRSHKTDESEFDRTGRWDVGEPLTHAQITELLQELNAFYEADIDRMLREGATEKSARLRRCVDSRIRVRRVMIEENNQ
jgi:hypothetical protein